MSDTPDPPRKHYTFRPPEFETVNQPSSAGSSPIELDALIKSANPDPAAPILNVGKPAAAKNEVHAMLQDNVDRARAAGLYELAPKPKRRSRRTRDYWTMLVVVNALFVGSVIWRPGVIVFAGAGIILFTVGLTWVVWVVMDDY